MQQPSRTVLLVEDDPADVALLERAFEKAGINASLKIAGDGEEAQAYLAGHGPFADRARFPLPNLVLLDIKMPRRSGMEVLEWIRKQKEFRSLPVVMLTSSRQAVNLRLAYDLGANSYLVKPVGFERLLETVRTFDAYWLQLNVTAGG